MLQLTLNTSGSAIELTNYILAQAIDELRTHEQVAKNFQLDTHQIDEIESFRKTLVVVYTEICKNQVPESTE